jgi:hypothetical protein
MLTLTAALAGCGGGTDAGDNTNYAWAQGVRNLFTANRSWTVSGKGSDGASYTTTLSYTASGNGTFPVTRELAARALQRFKMTSGGNTLIDDTSTWFYRESNLTLIGLDNGDGTCTVATASKAVPNSGRMGANMGTYANADALANCTDASAVNGLDVYGWSLQIDSGVTLLCQDNAFYDASGKVPQGSESDCVGINPDGSLNANARITIHQPNGWSWTGRNY